MEYTHYYDSPLGRMMLASDGDALTGIWFEGQKYAAAALSQNYEQKQLPVFEQAKQWLATYFGGKEPDFVPPLSMKGTPFRKEVWEALLAIPFGRTVTYGEIARNIAKRRGLASMSAQAVGNAVAHNPISLIVPCHRVIGADGSLTGYAGGLERKEWLLRMEGERNVIWRKREK